MDESVALELQYVQEVEMMRKQTRGTAMVEMIFVLPILLLLVFAIFQFGLMMSRWLTLSNAVREGARVGVAYRDAAPNCAATVQGEVEQTVNDYAAAGDIDVDDLTVNVSNVCGGKGTPLVVDATYPFVFSIPFVDPDPVLLSYSSTMRNEF